MGELVAALGRGPLEPDIGRSRRLVHAHAVTQQDGHAWDIALADAPSLRLEDLRDERIALADDRDAPGYNRAVTDAFARACVAPAFSDRAAGATAWERAVDGGCAGLSSACDIHARSASVRLCRCATTCASLCTC